MVITISVTIRNVAVAIMISVAVMMGNMVPAIRMAALLLHLPGRHITIAPALFLPLVPARRTLAVVIAVVIVTIVVAVGAAVFIVVLVITFAVPTFCEGTRS